MPHFYIPPENINGTSFILDGQEAHHIVRVLRYSIGSLVELFDGTGRSYSARIDGIAECEIRGTILQETSSVKSSIRVHLYQSVPKGDKFDWLVEKASELGIHTIIPLITERSVVREISPAKLERWQRLARAASKQSGRSDLVIVERPVAFTDALAHVPAAAVNIIPWESEDTKTVSDVFSSSENRSEAHICIGPEGGFTLDEIGQARAARLTPVTLGPRILRAETAGLLTAVLVMNLAGEFTPR